MIGSEYVIQGVTTHGGQRIPDGSSNTHDGASYTRGKALLAMLERSYLMKSVIDQYVQTMDCVNAHAGQCIRGGRSITDDWYRIPEGKLYWQLLESS